MSEFIIFLFILFMVFILPALSGNVKNINQNNINQMRNNSNNENNGEDSNYYYRGETKDDDISQQELHKHDGWYNNDNPIKYH